VSLAAHCGVSASHATMVLPIFMIGQVASGGALGALSAVIEPVAQPWLRATAAASALLVLPLHRYWIRATAERLTRASIDVRHVPPIPTQLSILRSFCWSTLTLSCSGLAFGVLLHALSPEESLVRAAVVFALAWTMGFLAIPFPSGVGVREAVMVAFLQASPAAVVMGSLLHRLLSIAAEVTLIALTRRLR
jgi:uncharacterized membrane protein YbhN (UPF0104 family)